MVKVGSVLQDLYINILKYIVNNYINDQLCM